MPDPQVTVNGQPRPLAGDARPHQRARLPARPRAHRRQGGLRRGRVRCLRRDGRAPRRGRHAAGRRSTPASCRPSRSTGRRSSPRKGSARPEHLHPVQAELAARGGSQCGYCTPVSPARWRRSTTGDRRPRPGRGGREPANGFDLHAIAGNLCRCTGYRPIRDAAWALGVPARRDPLAERQRDAPRPPQRCRPGSTGSPDPPTSPRRWPCSPSTPTPTVVAGLAPTGASRPTCAVAGRRTSSRSTGCRELREALSTDGPVEIGAAPDALREVEAAARRRRSRCSTEVWPLFASPLIRNGATIGGNLATASPIGDLAPALLALDAALRAGLRRRRPRGRAGRLLHRLPRDRAAARRADPGRPGAAPLAARDRVPQDRQAALRRHLQRRRRGSPSTSSTAPS